MFERYTKENGKSWIRSRFVGRRKKNPVDSGFFVCYSLDMEETKEKLAAKYIYGDIDQDVFKTVVKIYRKECEKTKIRQLKSLKKKNKREIRRNGRTKLLR